MRLFVFYLIIFIYNCKTDVSKDGEYLSIENCIKQNFAKSIDLKKCFDGYNYKIEGFLLKDSVFFISNFIDEPQEIDSLPQYVLMAYGKEGKSCQIRNDINFKVEKRFWVRNGTDSIFTIFKLY